MKIQKNDEAIFEKLSKGGKALLDKAYGFTDRIKKDNLNPFFNFVFDNGKNAICATDTRMLMRFKQSTGQKMLFNRHIVRLNEDIISKYPSVEKIFKRKASSHHKLFVSFLSTMRKLYPYYDTICFMEGSKTILYPQYANTGLFELPILDISYFITLTKVEETLHFDFGRFLRLLSDDKSVFKVALYENDTPSMIGFSHKGADYRLVFKVEYSFLDLAVNECFNYKELNEYVFLLKQLMIFCKKANEYDTGKIRVEGDFVVFVGDFKKGQEIIEIKSPLFAKFGKRRLNKIFRMKWGEV